MTEYIEEKIREGIREALRGTDVQCPGCAGMREDLDYICEVCWFAGGDGIIMLSDVIDTFTLKDVC